ncbi:MAG: hypothetical protein JW861_13580 [Bacteroidales bacterium]|nr:hypothetical protein [Bacteroidales bacterium]
MKKLSYFFLFVTQITIAQSPQAFRYQAVVRDNAGLILQNHIVGIRISIHDGNPGGTIVYQETFTGTTNEFGLMNLNIGTGLPVIGAFTGIDWGNSSKFIETEVDPAGGTSYVSMGTSPLLSVPFALYSGATGDTSLWRKSGDTIYYLTGNVGIGTASPQGELHINNPFEWQGITFTGTGLNDLTVDYSSFNGSGTVYYIAEVTNAGPNPNIFRYSNDNGATWTENVPMANSGIDVGYGVTIGFGALVGHTYGDQWSWIISESYSDELIVKNGNIGIGNSDPETYLHILSDTQFNPEALGGRELGSQHLVLTNGTQGLYKYGPALSFGGINTGRRRAAIVPIQTSNDPDQMGLAFFTHPAPQASNNTVTQQMQIDHNGNVSIGTTDAYAKLHILGAIGLTGLRVTDASYGMNISNSGSDGLTISSSGWHGISIYVSGHSGVYVTNSGDDGVYVYQSGSDWGFYAYNDKTYSQGGYYPAKSGSFAKNTGQEVLEPGDMVCVSGGLEENALGEESVPVINVSIARSHCSEALFGVVESRVYVHEENIELDKGNFAVHKSFRFGEGAINQGDYLTVVVFGIADVKVDVAGNIKSGQKLTVSETDGIARSIIGDENWVVTGILGKALENSDGSGIMKVFVNCR